jgi:hypothetical protein
MPDLGADDRHVAVERQRLIRRIEAVDEQMPVGVDRADKRSFAASHRGRPSIELSDVELKKAYRANVPAPIVTRTVR